MGTSSGIFPRGDLPLIGTRGQNHRERVLVPHQSDFDMLDLAAMGVALVYHNSYDGVLVPRSKSFWGNNSLVCSAPNTLKTSEKGY